jgi:hypothetical protein
MKKQIQNSRSLLLYSLLMIILCLIWAQNSEAQTIVKPNEKGIYTAVKDTTKKQTAVKTGKVYETANEEFYDIYKGASGAYFIIRISKKTGNPYRQYITLQDEVFDTKKVQF